MYRQPAHPETDLRDRLGASRPRAVYLVGLLLPGQTEGLVEDHLDELASLAESAGARVVGRAFQRRSAPDAAFFIGRGKAEEIGAAARQAEADVLLFDDDLSPSQVKNLEKTCDLQVLDRSGLILEIFRLRARTREARTQVELAELSYLLPRLTRRWRHLSRQAGGIGVRGGEGETQLEADRRGLRRRIQRLKKDLEKIERVRETQRRGRREIPTVALAGYTNAGKSTLFNRLTTSKVRSRDQLFATLDSTLRRGVVDPEHPARQAIFVDTVGFIRKLPHHLVSSFRSTLEEVVDADLVLHVVDWSHPAWEEQKRVAEEVLEELGVQRHAELIVLNKIDRVDSEAPAGGGIDGAVYVSSLTGEGIDALRAAIASRLDADAGPPAADTAPS